MAFHFGCTEKGPPQQLARAFLFRRSLPFRTSPLISSVSWIGTPTYHARGVSASSVVQCS